MQQNRIQNSSCPMYCTVFFRLLAFSSKNIIDCVMTYKMAWDERMCPVKNNHFIQDIFFITVSDVK